MAVTLESDPPSLTGTRPPSPRPCAGLCVCASATRFVTRSAGNGEVILSRAQAPEAEDPVLGQFLEFLADDMQRHPERLQGVDANFAKRVRAVVQDVELDLDAPLSAEDN